MKIVRCDESLRRWVQQRVDIAIHGPSENLGVIDNTGRIVAGVIYHNYRDVSIEETTAAESPKWCLPGIVRELLAYPFRQLGVQRITALITEDNARSIKVTEGLGFIREGVLRSAASNGRNVVVLGMTDDDYEARYGER